MQAKVAVAGVSLILAVGVIVGIVVMVSSNNDEEQNNGGLGTGMKAVKTLCAPTDYKELCMNTLSPVAKKDANVTAKDLVQVAFTAILEEVQKALNKFISLGKLDLTNSTIDKMSMDDCQELLQHAVYDLEMAVSKVADSDMHKLHDLLAELNNWLSAVVAYKSSCLDDIINPELQKSIHDGLMNTTHLTYNTLGNVDEISKILTKIDMIIPSVEQNHKARILLNTEMDKDGYPTWFSAVDRKLLASHNNQLRPDAVVAKDGSGQFKCINDAIAAYRKNPGSRYIIYVKTGIYEEMVKVPYEATDVYMYGDGCTKTIVTGNKSKKDSSTDQSATFAAMGNGFIAKSMGFRNTAGPECEQALALRVESDMSAFFDCSMEGYQDTLFTQLNRQFYSKCNIYGTIDFIFGYAAALIQNSKIIVRKPMAGQFNVITASGREQPQTNSGIVLQNCHIVSDFEFVPQIKSYLGRPWKAHSMTMIMQTHIGNFIDPEGWTPWNLTSTHHQTCEFMEYANKGIGADTSKRVQWPTFKVVTDKKIAERYTAGPFLQADKWLTNTDIEFKIGLSH
ncbi:hypothetical protein AQUCO_02900052v1 [Aquilegia coerulea]|uniref:Pectinesterase n=1 Tax=Aquilegia coerulea TaxID=218851 RepID=A0A2G5D339_AQUCA|nr:hypothetical protein AQUCO_02900052v1 [Aquilegia coerulea]